MKKIITVLVSIWMFSVLVGGAAAVLSMTGCHEWNTSDKTEKQDAEIASLQEQVENLGAMTADQEAVIAGLTGQINGLAAKIYVGFTDAVDFESDFSLLVNATSGKIKLWSGTSSFTNFLGSGSGFNTCYFLVRKDALDNVDYIDITNNNKTTTVHFDSEDVSVFPAEQKVIYRVLDDVALADGSEYIVRAVISDEWKTGNKILFKLVADEVEE